MDETKFHKGDVVMSLVDLKTSTDLYHRRTLSAYSAIGVITEEVQVRHSEGDCADEDSTKYIVWFRDFSDNTNLGCALVPGSDLCLADKFVKRRTEECIEMGEGIENMLKRIGYLFIGEL